MKAPRRKTPAALSSDVGSGKGVGQNWTINIFETWRKIKIVKREKFRLDRYSLEWGSRNVPRWSDLHADLGTFLDDLPYFFFWNRIPHSLESLWDDIRIARFSVGEYIGERKLNLALSVGLNGPWKQIATLSYNARMWERLHAMQECKISHAMPEFHCCFWSLTCDQQSKHS